MFNFLFSLATVAEQTSALPIQAQGTPVSTSYNFLQILSQLLPFILIALIFYLFIIRPQNQQRKQLADMINNLKIGDKVITKGGIIGKIYQIQENTLILEMFDGTKAEFLKHAVISMLDGDNN
jgi:preprotein translocase subunit YajC